MIVVWERNGVRHFESQESWNPSRNPVRTIDILNKISIYIAPKVRSWLRVSVGVWDWQRKEELGLRPRIVQDHLEFQAHGRVTVRIFDNKNKKFQELLAHWIKDKNGTRYPILEPGPEKPLHGERRLSVKMKIPKTTIADDSEIEKKMVEKQVGKSLKNNSKRRIRNGREERQKHPRKAQVQEKFNPKDFTGLAYDRVKEISAD